MTSTKRAKPAAKRKRIASGASKKAHKIRADKFAAAYVNHACNGTRAYQSIAPHVTPKTASVQAVRMLARDNIRAKIDAILKKRKKTQLDYVIGTVADQQDASKPVMYNGAITDTYPDNQARLAAARTLLQLHGAIDAKSSESSSAGRAGVCIIVRPARSKQDDTIDIASSAVSDDT